MDTKTQCENPCLFRYTWPGKDESYVCLEHTQGLLNLAHAIGLPLQMIVFQPDRNSHEWPNCKQQVESERRDNENQE